ncbi:A24 family peptidase [Phenylobacterium sp.]|uniref:prepilin peptidase n=1 Tax=Phenylobacterium sp. TaxID=1871053 RepID=UPI002CB9BC9A|nr:A24 family peptidase [Phenylobacterium sp.]HLZ77179.1 A24 family peptidase [Phenylobacterium sp.]
MTANGGLLALAAVSGLALGSYAVTAGVRLSRAETSHAGRSHCDYCDAPLSYLQTVPVISYLRAGGICAVCGARIDPIHLAGELAGATVLVTAIATGAPLRAALMAIIGLCLVAEVAVDAKVQRLPNRLTLAVALGGATLSALSGWMALGMGLLAALASGAILLQLRRSFARRRGDPGLGLGDVKLISALALWLGVATPLMVLGAAVLGLAASLLVRPARQRTPFGPMIAASGWALGVALEQGWRPWAV